MRSARKVVTDEGHVMQLPRSFVVVDGACVLYASSEMLIGCAGQGQAAASFWLKRLHKILFICILSCKLCGMLRSMNLQTHCPLRLSVTAIAVASIGCLSLVTGKPPGGITIATCKTLDDVNPLLVSNSERLKRILQHDPPFIACPMHV